MRLGFGLRLLLGYYDAIHHILLILPHALEALQHQGAHMLGGGQMDEICFIINFFDLHRTVTNRWCTLGLKGNQIYLFYLSIYDLNGYFM